MKKVLFPLVTALMVGCLPMQSVMAKKPQVTNNYDRDLKICTDSFKNIKINPPSKVYRYEETKVYRYKNDFSFSYPREYHLEKMGTAWNEGRDGLIIYDPYNWKYGQCKKSKNIQDDEQSQMADISIIKAPNLQQYKNSMESYAYSDFRTEKSNNGYQIAKYMKHDMDNSSCVVFEHPRNLYLVEVCGLLHFLNINTRSQEPELDDESAFNLIVSKFCFLQPNNDTLQDCGIWNNLKRDEVDKSLDELIKDPKILQQGQLGLCGPAAFFRIWLERDPEAVKRYVTELYNTGSSHIGNLEIKASESLRGQNFDDIKKAIGIQATDWIMMSALRDSGNNYLHYKGNNNLLEDYLSDTSPTELKKWLEATGLYQKVENNSIGPLSSNKANFNLDHALNLVSPSSEKDVILLIDTGMINEDKPWSWVPSLAPNHYIVLTSPILVQGDNVSFEYWTWDYKPKSTTISKAQFEKFYWGGIVGTRKK